jgi:autotransporter-associated beta strand protein
MGSPPSTSVLRRLGSGTFTLIDYSGAIGGGGFSPSTFTLGALPPRTVGSLVNNAVNSSIDVSITSDGPRWNGTIDGNWDTTTQNWKGAASGTNTTYIEGDQVLFNDAATGTTSVNLASAVAPSLVTASNSTKDYTISGGGAITGATALFKQGTGKLTISNSGNAYTGGTVIQAGTLAYGVTNALPASGNITLSGGTLDLAFTTANLSGNVILSGGTIANGTVVKTGSNYDVRTGLIDWTSGLNGDVGLTKTGPAPSSSQARAMATPGRPSSPKARSSSATASPTTATSPTPAPSPTAAPSSSIAPPTNRSPTRSWHHRHHREERPAHADPHQRQRRQRHHQRRHGHPRRLHRRIGFRRASAAAARSP